MTELLHDALLVGLLSGAAGHAFAEGTQPGMLLAPYGRWLLRLLASRQGWLRWLAKPLGACAICSTAWLAAGAAASVGLPPLAAVAAVGAGVATVQVLQAATNPH